MDKIQKYAVFAAHFNSEVIALRDAQDDEPKSVNYKKGDMGTLSFLNYSQTISANGGEESEEWPFGITFKDHYVLLWDISDFALLKKSSGRIADEDAISVCELYTAHLNDRGYTETALKKEKARVSKELLKSIFDCTDRLLNPFEILAMFDDLRALGYALPYKNWSVEQLVEFGIYKLID